MFPIVQIDRVAKTFRTTRRKAGWRDSILPAFEELHAIREVSFAIEPGEAVGYLGPNGAGKSTMIKLLTGILAPTSGRVTVLGRSPLGHRIENARQLGVVFGQRSQLWWDLPVSDSFRLHRDIYDIPVRRHRATLASLTQMLGVDRYIDRPVRLLSLGERMRAELVMALLHEPRLLILDEPTLGLDVLAKETVRSFLSTANRDLGVTVLLTSHDLKDVESVCPRVIMVDDGRLLFDGTLVALKKVLGSKRLLTVEYRVDPGDIELRGAKLIASDGKTKRFAVVDAAVALVSLVQDASYLGDLLDVRMEDPDIEDLVAAYYREKESRGG